MAGRSPQRFDTYPGIGQEVSPALFRHQRFWLKMATYRPLLILAGIWAVLLAIAIIAYGQLLQTAEESAPRKNSDASLPELAQAQPPVESDTSSLDSLPLDKPLNQSSGELSEPLPSAPFTAMPETGEASTTITALSPVSLLALVVTCASGCLIIARQLQTDPRTPQRSRSRREATHPRRTADKPAPQPTPKPTPASTELPKMAPYDPTQPLSKTPLSQRGVQRGVPRSNAGKLMGDASLPSAATNQGAAANVTVVSNAVQHSLDWPQDSLVNTQDVRRQRSLSSFM